MRSEPGRWFRLMLIAFLTNGIGPFGLKVLDEMHLAQYQLPYLISWYGGGTLMSIVTYRRSFRFSRWEWILGPAMGACSLGGQYLTGLALASGMPGHVAFPITTGGTLFIVAILGIAVFQERVGLYGKAGLVLGIAALVILSLG